jgi:hypothetical protein
MPAGIVGFFAFAPPPFAAFLVAVAFFAMTSPGCASPL